MSKNQVFCSNNANEIYPSYEFDTVLFTNTEAALEEAKVKYEPSVNSDTKLPPRLRASA